MGARRGGAGDADQEAIAVAAARWPADGVPARVGAWLTTTVWPEALDGLRRRRALTPLAVLPDRAGPEPGPFTDLELEDDLLGLVLACCHPIPPRAWPFSHRS